MGSLARPEDEASASFVTVLSLVGITWAVRLVMVVATVSVGQIPSCMIPNRSISSVTRSESGPFKFPLLRRLNPDL